MHYPVVATYYSVFIACYIALVTSNPFVFVLEIVMLLINMLVFRFRVWLNTIVPGQPPQLGNVSCAVRHSHVAFSYICTPILLLTSGFVLLPFGPVVVLVSYGGAVVVAVVAIVSTASYVKWAKSWGRMRDVRILKAQLRRERKARERLRKKNVLSKHAIFSKLKESSINKLLEVMELRVYKANELLCKQGDVADRLFVLISGSVHVDIEDTTLQTSERVATFKSTSQKNPIFGESSILDEKEQFRTATLVAAVGSALTMEINKKNYFILEQNGDLVDEGEEGAAGKSSLREALRKQANKARSRLKKKGVSVHLCLLYGVFFSLLPQFNCRIRCEQKVLVGRCLF